MEGTTTKELLSRSGYAHAGWVYIDSESDETGVIEKGYAVVVGADGKRLLNGLLVVPTKDDDGKVTFRRVGIFVLVNAESDDPEAPVGDLGSWISTPAEIISII